MTPFTPEKKVFILATRPFMFLKKKIIIYLLNSAVAIWRGIRGNGNPAFLVVEDNAVNLLLKYDWL